jgi:hypothetical protein
MGREWAACSLEKASIRDIRGLFEATASFQQHELLTYQNLTSVSAEA